MLMTSIQTLYQNSSPILRQLEDRTLVSPRGQSLTQILKKFMCKDIQLRFIVLLLKHSRFCGLVTDTAGMTGCLPGELYNWVYRYGARPGTWTRILSQANQPQPVDATPSTRLRKREEPYPRYAHEVVYDTKTKQVYLFGGNTSFDDSNDAESMGEANFSGIKKMNDFWKMEVCR